MPGTELKNVEREIRDLRKDKASVDLVEAKCEPIGRSIDDLWSAVNGIRGEKHVCLKEEQLQALKEIPSIRDELGSWKLFKTLMIGAVGTLLLLGVTAIIAFTTVRADTERSKEDIKEQKQEVKKTREIFTSFRHDLAQIKSQNAKQGKQKEELKEIKSSLKEIAKSLKDKKKR